MEIKDLAEVTRSQSKAHETAEPAPHTSTPQLSLAGYWRLPREIQEQIILAACGYHPYDRSSILDRSAMSKKTMLGLSAASKHFYRMTVPLLYQRVYLARPSALRAFHQTLALRPVLGRLVKRLHLGPDKPLDLDWFPMQRCVSGLQLKINLDVERDSQPLYEGATPYEVLYLNDSLLGYASSAMRKGFDAVSRDLDVDLCKVRFSHTGRSIGTDPWHIRVFEAQAALELYCLAMRRAENEQKLHATPGERVQFGYPRLVVEGGSEAAPPADEDEVLFITRSQLHKRIARPGAPTDSFTHPLLFQRSGSCWLADGDEEFDLEGGVYDRQGEAGEDAADLFALPSMVRSTRRASDDTSLDAAVPVDLCDPLNAATSCTSTVGGNLALARSVLAFTPMVQSLSLTGIFERAVAGARSPPSLLVLRSLTLGPPPTTWGKVLQLDHAALYSLEKLRICDTTLAESEVDSLAGNDGALPNLRTFRYSMPTFMPTDPEENAEIFDHLLGVDREALASNLAPASQLSRKRPRSSEQNEAEDGGHPDNRTDEAQQQTPHAWPTHRRQTLVEAYLHPDDIGEILAAAPSEDVKLAWCSGKAVRGIRHRMKLEEHSGWSDSAEPSSCEDRKALQALYDEGKEWWEEG